jgi:branched-chain amino acid transport system permease protein
VSQILQLTILGLLLGGVYAVMATGLTMVYGVMGIINLAHAGFMVIGAYISFKLFSELGVDPFVSILVTGPALFLLGVVLYRLLFVSFGLALVIEGVLGAGFTNIYHRSDVGYGTATWDLGSVFIPQGQFYGFVASLVLLGLLWAFLYLTRTGYAIRATMQNRSAAQIVGVNVERVSTIAFGLGVGTAGAAGSLMSYLFTFFPGAHWQWIALLLSLIVVGGLGSLGGALVGGIGLAIIAAYVTDIFGPTWSQMTFYVALFVVLLVRPQGLFGKPLPA